MSLPRSARWPTRSLARASALLLLLAACSGTGFQYVTSSETNTFFKVPSDWRLYDEEDVFTNTVSGLSPQQRERSRAAQWIEAFDASPDPSIDHVLNPGAKHPAGFARVRVIQSDERDDFSLNSLKNEVFQLDDLDGANRLEVISSDDVVLDSGVHGTKMVYNLRTGGDFFTVNQTALVDPETRLLYVFMIGCQADCYVDNESLIQQVADSWTIKER
jgi:hypothetical protein